MEQVYIKRNKKEFLILWGIFIILLLHSHCVRSEDAASKSESDPTLVRVSGGYIHGVVKTTLTGNKYTSFQGIPFAETPVGKDRLKYSKLGTKNWDGVLDADKPGPACIQPTVDGIKGEEDCLHLSVYVPDKSRIKKPKWLDETEDNPPLPVLVWLHGGAYITGSAADYSPHLMMNENSIVVIPQYRLGLLGFHTFHHPNVSGNMGMIDQVVALQWVQENIAAFGGDSNNVALGGDCAGGASALYHLMSPLSEGLFHRVISFSGTPLNPWALAPNGTKILNFFCVLQGCPPIGYIQLDYFRDENVTNLEEFIEIQKNVTLNQDIMVGNFKLAPDIQFEGTPEDVWFLRDHPINNLVNGKVHDIPVLLGVTKNVGSYLVDFAFYTILQSMKMNESDVTAKKLDLMSFAFYNSNIRNEDTRNKIMRKYFPNWHGSTDIKDIDRLPLEILGELFGDLYYNAGILMTAKLLSDVVPTFVFRFDYSNGPKLFDVRNEGIDPSYIPNMDPGVSMGDEMAFFLPFDEKPLNEDDEIVSKNMMSTLQIFIKGMEPLMPEFTKEKLRASVADDSKSTKLGLPFVTKKKEKILNDIIAKQFPKFNDVLEKVNTITASSSSEKEQPKYSAKRDEL